MHVSTVALLAAIHLGGAIAAPRITPQGDDDPDNIICSIQNYQPVFSGHISQSLDYLHNHNPNDITLDWQEGGGWCSRVSCQADAGIYACNDNPFSIVVSLSTVADFAQDIMNTKDCQGIRQNGRWRHPTTQGQAFNNTGGWNTIVGMRGDDEC